MRRIGGPPNDGTSGNDLHDPEEMVRGRCRAVDGIWLDCRSLAGSSIDIERSTRFPFKAAARDGEVLKAKAEHRRLKRGAKCRRGVARNIRDKYLCVPACGVRDVTLLLGEVLAMTLADLQRDLALR